VAGEAGLPIGHELTAGNLGRGVAEGELPVHTSDDDGNPTGNGTDT
jgi:hypothetical protein